MHSLRGTIITILEVLQPSILSMVFYVFLTLKFEAMHSYQRTFFQHISEHKLL